VGTYVAAGQQLGFVGDHTQSGGCSTVDHLHLGITYNNEWVNSYLFLLQGGALPIPPMSNGDEMIPRVILQGGAGPYVILTDEWTKPLTGVTGDQVIELNKFLTYDPSYYPNGKLGAAVMSTAQYNFFKATLAPPA
jgi:murein DD-endopeptidase MepM/ murein hydrolase activator NlpD